MNKKRILCLAMTAVMAFAVSGSPESMAAKKSKKVKLNKSKLTLRVGDTFKLKLKNNKKKVTWSSSKKKVATVDKKGKVKAVKKGSAKITAKVAKKKYVCNVKVNPAIIKATVPPAPTTAVAAVTIAGVTVLDKYTVQVNLTGPQALAKENFIVKTKNFNRGNYNRELKIASVLTTDNVTYQITLDVGRAIFDDEFVQVTINNLPGIGTASKETMYSEGKFNYQSTKIFKTMQNEKVDAEYYMSGKGYSLVKAVTGLPAGVTYKTDKAGTSILFGGKATAEGTFAGTIVTEDEVGNTYTVKMTWIVGSDKCIAAAYQSKYGVVGKNSFSFYDSISICGGSGKYLYELLDKKGDFEINSDGSLEAVIYDPGTYQIKVKVTDAEDSSISTTAVCDISCVKGKTVAGIIKDGLGNAIQGQSMTVSFSNIDKANLYTASLNAYSETTGAYSATLAEGIYEAYVNYNDARSSMIKCQVNADKSGVDFALPIYPVTFTCDDEDFDVLSGYWEDEDGNEYYMNGKKMYLEEGTHTFTNTYSTGFFKYEASTTFTVTASANNVAKVTLVKKNLLEEKLKGNIKAGEPLSVEVTGSDYTYYSFVPEKTAEYRFYSTADDDVYYDTYGVLMDEKGELLRSNDDGGESDNFSYTYMCEKGVKYYVGIRTYSGSAIVQAKLCVEEYVPVNDEE